MFVEQGTGPLQYWKQNIRKIQLAYFSHFIYLRILLGVILANILKVNHILKSVSNSTIISGEKRDEVSISPKMNNNVTLSIEATIYTAID